MPHRIEQRTLDGSQTTITRTPSNGSRHTFLSTLSELTEPTDGYATAHPGRVHNQFAGTTSLSPSPAYFSSESDEEDPVSSYFVRPAPAEQQVAAVTATAAATTATTTTTALQSPVVEVAAFSEFVSGLGNDSACCHQPTFIDGAGVDGGGYNVHGQQSAPSHAARKHPILWGIAGILFVVIVVATGLIGYTVVGSGGDGDSSSASENSNNDAGSPPRSPTSPPTTTTISTPPTLAPTDLVTQTTPTQSPFAGNDTVGIDCPEVPALVPQQNDEDTRLARYALDWFSALPLVGAGDCDTPIYSVSATCTNSGSAILYSRWDICSVRQNRVRCTAMRSGDFPVEMGCFGGDRSQTNLFVQIDTGVTTCYDQSNEIANAVIVSGLCEPSPVLRCINSSWGRVNGFPSCLQVGSCDLETGQTECVVAYTGARISAEPDESCLEGFSRTRQVGERCIVDAECLSKLCAGRQCRVRPGCTNDDCVFDAHCQDGLVCENEICVPV